MIKAHKIRLNPTLEQEAYFRNAVGVARFVFNWGLAEWKRRKAEYPGQQHGVMEIKKDFNALKAAQYPWVYEVAKDVAEGAFAHLTVALKNYFESKKGSRTGRKIGFPHFKSKKSNRQSFRLNNDKIHAVGHSFYVPRLGWVNMAEILRFEGKILGATVSQHAEHWYVAITVETDRSEPHRFYSPIVGIDLGVKTLMVLSDGRQCENQALLRKELTHLKRLSRRLSRRKIGSQRWYRAKKQLGRFHASITNRRRDILHKATTEIARTYAVIGLENLNTASLLKNHTMALSLSDASFGEIRRQLIYKSQWFGGQVVFVDRFFPSSRRCSSCGEINHELSLHDRSWICSLCGTTHDRDLNAAINIAIEAHRITHIKPR